MFRGGDTLLTPAQSNFVEKALGVPVLVRDLSWSLTDTKVLHVRAAGGDFIVKAAGPDSDHVAKEIAAHRSYTAPLVVLGQAGKLVAADRLLRVIVITHQPGSLVEGTSDVHNPEIYLQAGSILRVLHSQHARLDHQYEHRETERTREWLRRPHRIDPDLEREAERLLGIYKARPLTVVPTHGDWQPRNWLSHQGQVRVIDFGRFAFRPPATDLCRIAVQQWQQWPGLEAAFLAGYQADPREETTWRIFLLREAVGTAVWAFSVGDYEFEARGLRMLADAIARF